MKRHATSHALAVFTCTVTGALLAREVGELMPGIRAGLHHLAEPQLERVGLTWSPETVMTLLTATVLAILWGISFAMINNLFSGRTLSGRLRAPDARQGGPD